MLPWTSRESSRIVTGSDTMVLNWAPCDSVTPAMSRVSSVKVPV